MKTIPVRRHLAHASTILTILRPKTCRSQTSTPVRQPGHAPGPHPYRQVRSRLRPRSCLGRADESSTSACEALLKAHAEFERKFFLLHDRVALARTFLQMVSIEDRDVPAGVLDHAPAL